VPTFDLTAFLRCMAMIVILLPDRSAMHGSALSSLQLTITINMATVQLLFAYHHQSVVETSAALFGLTTFLPCVAMTLFFHQLVWLVLQTLCLVYSVRI
jgi:hypothetical protein